MVDIDSEITAALLGAIVGVLGASLITRWSVLFERKMAACDAVLAMADEAQFNADVLQHRRKHLWGFSSSSLERQAFDAALPALWVLPPDLRSRAREARAEVLQFNFIEAMLAGWSSQHDRPADSMIKRRLELIDTLPVKLDELATSVKAFITNPQRPIWRRRLGASTHAINSGVR